jgi:hypothetical protein
MVSTAIQASLPATRGKAMIGLAELGAAERVVQAASSSAFCATPTARAAVWTRRRFEGRHQLLEALALDAAQQVLRRDSKPSKPSSYSFMPR